MHDKSDFSDFKQEINLTQYAARLGYEIDRKKSTRTSIVMRKDHQDKVIISKRDGNWIYFSVYDDRDNGTIINFIQNRTNKTLIEIAQELQLWIGGGITLPHPKDYAEHVDEKKSDADRIKKLFNYCSPITHHEYLASRGIIEDILKSVHFYGRVFKDNFNNAVFPHFNENGVCALELKNEDIGFFVRGSEKTLWRSNVTLSDETLLISETAIDAISYQILHSPNDAFYTATSGGLSPLQADYLTKLFRALTQIKEVILITDNDQGGDTLTGRLTQVINQSKFNGSINRHSPDIRGEDWNNVLKDQLGI